MEVKALATDLPAALPGDDVSYLLDLLTGKAKLERLRAVKAAYGVVGHLLSKFFGDPATTMATAVKPKKVSRKKIAEALAELQTPGPSAKALPAWLIPILLGLAKQWLEGGK